MENGDGTRYFMLWYVLNIGYNIYNKQALNALPLPWTFGLIQMFAGIPYVAESALAA